MKLLKSLGLAALAGLLVVPAPAAAPPPVTVKVVPNVGMAPATVRVTVKVEPDGRNRGLMVEADSQDFYSSSEITLDGNESSRTQRFEFKNLPPGRYEIRATVERNDGNRQMANAEYLVSG